MSRFGLANVVRGVGVPTGEAHANSQPGTNTNVDPASIQDPALSLQYLQKNISVITLTGLDQAGQTTQIDEAGTLLFYSAALDAANGVLLDRAISIAFDRVNNTRFVMLPGQRISGIPFDRIFVITPGNGAADDSAQLFIVTDTPDDRVLVE